MRRFCIILTALVMITLTMAGCGGSDDGVTHDTAAPETAITQAAAADTTTTLLPDTTNSTAQPPVGNEWTTVARLRSTDSPWQGMEGILMSEPFTVSGETRLVLDMPDAGESDGVIVAILPDDMVPEDAFGLLDVIDAAVFVTVPAMMPTREVSGLDGTYVLINTTNINPASGAWSLELQAR